MSDRERGHPAKETCVIDMTPETPCAITAVHTSLFLLSPLPMILFGMAGGHKKL